MIGDVKGGGGAQSAPTGGGFMGNAALGRDEFLQLLVAQLRNQDPLSPMEPDQFASQLAQFSQVEQLIELNATGKAGVLATRELQEAQNNASAMNAIGKEILAVGNGFTVAPPDEETGLTTPTTLSVSVGGKGGTGTLVILDRAGNEVVRENVGFLPGGRSDLSLPPGTELEPGNYTYRLDLTDDEGEAVEVITFTRALVDGVRYGSRGAKLIAAGVEIPLGSVVEILDRRP